MSNGWVRLWHDMPTDPKWRVIARKSGRSISEVIAVFTFLMVNASANANERGRTHNLFAEDIAAALDLNEADILSILDAMEGKVLCEGKLTGWEVRQPKREDNSAERAKIWRENKKCERKRTQTNANERPDTDTDTDNNISSLRSDIPAPARKKPSPGFSRPDWLDAQAWEDFEKMRKALKKPLTDRARSAIVAKLERWRGQHDPTEILERSIVNCWQDIYEPKGQENGGFDGNSGKIGEADRGQSPQRLGGGAQAPKPSGGGWTGRAEAYAEKLKAGHRPPKLF